MNNSKNIRWQTNKVSYEERCELLGQRGLVVWFTGLSGAGKSTIAVEVERVLRDNNKAVYLLDGDNLRHGINADLGFGQEDRNENVRRIAEIAALFQDAGIIVLCACISPYSNMREYARNRIANNHFIEVYVKADIMACKARDPKGLYKKAIESFTGISSPYEEPLRPELCVDTTILSVHECVALVVEEINNKLK